MEIKVQVGDVVISTAGRDKGQAFLVISETEKEIFIVDGKIRKVKAPKKKNKKHVKVILSDAEKPLAEKIAKGEAVANERIKKLLTKSKNKK